MFSAPIKSRSRCYASFIALQGGRVHENVEHSQHRENVIFRDRSHVVELLLQLENKQQCGDSTQAYIGSLCNVDFPMARFTCIVTSQVFMENLNVM